MFRLLKKMIIGSIDWFLYTFLKERQKEFLSNLFTDKQKQRLKNRMKPGKKQAQMIKVERIKYRLYNLGFKEKGLADLEAVAADDSDPYLKRLATWELALWHANQYNKEAARKCLDNLSLATRNVKDQDFLRRAAILEAESHHLLGDLEEAERVITHALASKKHADLYLAAANLKSHPDTRVAYINKVFDLYDVPPIELNKNTEKSPYDNLEEGKHDRFLNQDKVNKVTIIIPVYNAGTFVRTALDSILTQTWENLEVIVVDDHSTDNTMDIVEEYVEEDSRVQLLQTEVNSGAYTARNTALQMATGDFITINDADDWSHPEKIKTQVQHLIENPKQIGNFSQQARATEDLQFYRRGKPGLYIFSNMSSFMFRREPVMEKLGYWDSVRFAGDSEFVKRIKLVFGEKSITELETAPLSFQRQSEGSLTGDSAFGFPGYFMGVRKEYAEAHEHYHARNKENLRYEFPESTRAFPVPEPMWPKREEKDSGWRHFDVIIASEFRLLGGTNMSNIEEIKAQKRMGLSTGLVQMNRYDLNSAEVANPKVRELVDGDQVQMIVYGEKVTCDVLIVRHPPILQEWQKYIPEIDASQVNVIVNQPPQREYSENGETLYDFKRSVEHLHEYMGKSGVWYPIGPRIRETLVEHHADELNAIKLASEDWVNIIDINEWRRTSRPSNKKIRIGRHSRDQYVKWPADKTELMSLYPESEVHEIHVLGGAKAPKNVLGELPSNWHVFEFGDMEPVDFLAGLDVFVYYTHPDWVEAFGRVIFEAMAVGVPVIIPPSYENLFADAAIYAEPADVQNKINQLMSDDIAYQAQVDKAQAYVERHFGYTRHATRLGEVAYGRQ